MSTKRDQKSTIKAYSIFDIICNEKIRIMKKGFQVFIGLGITISFFCFAPTLTYYIYRIISSSLNPKLLIAIGIPLSGGICELIFNLLMNHIYAYKYDYFEQYRIIKKPWPWEVDEIGYKTQYREIVIATVVGHIFIAPIVTYSLVYFNLVEFILDPDLYPSPFEFFLQIMYMMIVFDTLFYWSHRLFHTSWLYKKFHKQHHEYQVTVSIATSYNHPFDFIITNVAPSLISLIALRKIHIITAYLLSFYANALAVSLHSGYDIPWFPWSIFPFGLSIDFHDFHHSANVGNFGLFSTFWDSLCGTNNFYLKNITKTKKNG